ncbi:MAG: sigma-70 family RNA polymerase sigma factor [Candidatus Acidiferrales bacterium]
MNSSIFTELANHLAGAGPIASQKAATQKDVQVAWPDPRLGKECLDGSEEAWSALVDKYKNLIFSIPIKYGFSGDEASDIFQGVCLELLSDLPKLRKPKALPKWIMQVTSHKCFHRKRQMLRIETSNDEKTFEQRVSPCAEGVLRQAEEEHALGEAIASLPPRCRDLVRMLFFEEPPRPYQQVAESLGIATGSIGFIRQRCLDRLRVELKNIGFE